MAKYILDALYSKVDKALSDKNNIKSIKTNFDRYMANNVDAYMSTIGPSIRPIFSNTDISRFIQTIGLTSPEIRDAINKTIKNKSVKYWYKLDNEIIVANVLATRYFTIAGNDDYVKMCIGYMIFERYPSLHHKYYKHLGRSTDPNIMEYTINNISNKFKIKQAASLWQALMEIATAAYEHFKSGIVKGDDASICDYALRMQTSLNSFMRKISVAYHDNWTKGNTTKVETEIFEDEKYYEGDSNSLIVDKLTNKVVSHLVVNGPDMKLVEISAKMNNISVNLLRSYTQTMITEKQRNDIYVIVERILSLYLISDEPHKANTIGTNEFLLYCLQLYKKSNTINKDIIKIKTILDKWLVDLGIMNKTSRDATINGFRKALFVFFVLTIQKLA